MRTYLHTDHACGRQVWWSNSDLAKRRAARDCPWCGGKAKQDFPPLHMALKIEQPQQETVSALSSLDDDPVEDENDDCVLVHHADESTYCDGLLIADTPDRFAQRRRIPQ